MAVFGGMKKKMPEEGAGVEGIGVKFEAEGLKKFSFLCGLVGSIL